MKVISFFLPSSCPHLPTKSGWLYLLHITLSVSDLDPSLPPLVPTLDPTKCSVLHSSALAWLSLYTQDIQQLSS